MLRFIFIAIALMTTSCSDASSGCSKEETLSLIGADYTKSEISDLCGKAEKQNRSSRTSESAKKIISNIFYYLYLGEIDKADNLFFKVPILEKHSDEWLIILKRLSIEIKQGKSDLETLCGKELSAAAVVLVQGKKHGKIHGDPHGMFLVKKEGHWKMLPDSMVNATKLEVRNAMTSLQVSEQQELKRWVDNEILGVTTECNRLH